MLVLMLMLRLLLWLLLLYSIGLWHKIIPCKYLELTIIISPVAVCFWICFAEISQRQNDSRAKLLQQLRHVGELRTTAAQFELQRSRCAREASFDHAYYITNGILLPRELRISTSNDLLKLHIRKLSATVYHRLVIKELSWSPSVYLFFFQHITPF